MEYEVKIITTDDPQLDGLNVVLLFENYEEAVGLAEICIEQGYTVQLKETDDS